MSIRSLLLMGVLLASSAAAQAHYLWIERDADGDRIYFGEWQADLREHESGPLKAIQGATAQDADGKALTIERKPDYLVIKGAGRADLQMFDEVMHRSAKVIYDIRYGRTRLKAGSNFELVPTSVDGNTLVLMLDGKPLPKVEVTVFGPPKWEKHYTTDEQGQIRIETPWAGFYVIRAQSDDDTQGEFEGKPYSKIINVAILSFEVEKGLPWTSSVNRGMKVQRSE